MALSSGQPYGDIFPVIDPADNQERVALAYNGTNAHLVTWQDNQVSGWNTYAAIFRPRQETVITYTYDPLYRLTEANYKGTLNANYLYEYDAVGNMTFFTETVGITVTRVQRYFNAANQLIDSFDYEAGTTSFTYDGNGNLTQQRLPGGAATWFSYHYNQRNLLTQYEQTEFEGGTTLLAEYHYDGASNRLQQVDLTGSTPLTTTYTNDILGLSQVLVADDGTTQTTHLFGLDLISQQTGNETRTLLTDGLGSVRTEMVENSIETVTTYDPYGNLLSQTGISETTYGFTGEQQDSAAGLLYLRARYYNSSLRSFMAKDPWGGNLRQPATLHGFSYVTNNPIRLIDPYGLCQIDPYDPYIDYECSVLAAEVAQRTPTSNDFDYFNSKSYEELLGYRDSLILADAEVSGVDGIIEFFEADYGPANIRLEQLLRKTGSFQQQFGIKIPGGDNLCDEFSDQIWYDTLWGGGQSFQMSHFLTAVSLTYNNLNPNGPPFSTNIYGGLNFMMGRVFEEKDSMLVALKLIIGHELVGDTATTDWLPNGGLKSFIEGYAQPLAWPLQYNATTDTNIDDFMSALSADLSGDISTRNTLLSGILNHLGGTDATPTYTGNSFQDLLLSLKGVEFGGKIRLGDITSSQHAAQWLKSNLTK